MKPLGLVFCLFALALTTGCSSSKGVGGRDDIVLDYSVSEEGGAYREARAYCGERGLVSVVWSKTHFHDPDNNYAYDYTETDFLCH